MPIVKDEGNLYTAKMMIVGESPGKTEMETGRPFVGWSGKMLFRELRIWGINRSDCFITNVINTQTNFGTISENKLEEGRNEVIRKAKAFRGKVILLLGAQAFHTLFPEKRSIVSWRGSPLIYNGIYSIPSIHPAALARNWSDYPLFVLDIKRAAGIASGRINPTEAPIKFNYNCGVSEAEYLNSEADEISFDIETNRGKRITMIGLAPSPTESYNFKLSFDDIPKWQAISRLLSNKRIKKIAQNGFFDIFHLADYRIPVANYYWDTMIAQHIIYPEMKKSLAVLASIWTFRHYWKDTSREDEETYNMLDAAVTFEIYSKQKNIILSNPELKKAFELEMSEIQPALYMSYNGVRVDKKLMDEAANKMEEKLLQVEDLIGKICGDININSNKQLMDYFFNRQGYKPIISRSTGRPTVNEKALNELSYKGDKAAELIIEYRKRKKLLSTYFKAKLNSGRVRTFFDVAGTVSGRFSSSKVPNQKEVKGKGDEGLNLQNLPHGDARRVLIADDGYTMCNIDERQSEARTVAYLAGDERMITLLESGEDIYISTAKKVFNIEEVSKEVRQLTKKLVHAANYKVGWRTFALEAKITPQQAKVALENYYSTFVNIPKWHKYIEDTVSKTRKLTTPFGRERYFFERSGNELYNKAINYVPQSIGVDYLNSVMIRIWNTIPEAKLLLQSHDGLLLEVPTKLLDGTMRGRIYDCLKLEIEINRRKVILPFDVKFGYNYEEVS